MVTRGDIACVDYRGENVQCMDTILFLSKYLASWCQTCPEHMNRCVASVERISRIKKGGMVGGNWLTYFKYIITFFKI